MKSKWIKACNIKVIKHIACHDLWCLFLVFTVVLLLPPATYAATLEVGTGKTYTTIQSAINAAAVGDTVLVYDGTYFENINFFGKAITVRSVNGANTTTIDGSAKDQVVTFQNGEGAGTVLEGFTIRNGLDWNIRCDDASPVIVNCIIKDLIEGHSSGMNPNFAVVCAGGSSPLIINCVIVDNAGGGIGCGNDSLASNSPLIINCTISGNKEVDRNIGVGIVVSGNSSPIVKNSIVWGNHYGGTLPEIYLEEGATIDVTYSDVEGGYAGAGNTNDPPNFVGSGDYHLQTGSPCIDAGDSAGAPADDLEDIPRPQGSGYDMGSYEYYGSNVAPLYTYDNSYYVVLASPPETSLNNVQAITNPSPSDTPAEANFSFGFFDFNIAGVSNGGTSIVTLYLPQGVTADTYYKYGPEPDNTAPHWYEFIYNGQTGAEINGNIITLHFIDGQRGDGDLAVNGTIVDPGAPSIKEIPTLITLSSFTATPKSGKVIIISWTTASEIDNSGFNLYRATAEDGEYIKINGALISAKGTSTQGANYEFIDKDVKNRKTYYYKLEDIDLSGISTMHGPVSATPRMLFGIFGK